MQIEEEVAPVNDVTALLNEYEQTVKQDPFTAGDLDVLLDRGGDAFDLMCNCLRVGYMVGLKSR